MWLKRYDLKIFLFLALVAMFLGRLLFCSILREHICCLNIHSGSKSPLKPLSESHEVAAILEPVLRACLLPLAAPGAKGSQNGFQAIVGRQEAVFGTPVQNNSLKPHCQVYKLQVAQKSNTRFIAILESTSAVLTPKVAPEAH